MPEFLRSSLSERALALLAVLAMAAITFVLGRWLGRRLKGTTRLGLRALERLAAPITLLVVAVGTQLLLRPLSDRPELLTELAELVAIFAGFWLASRMLEVLLRTAADSVRLRHNTSGRAALISARRLGSALLWVTAAITLAVKLGAGSQLYLLLGGLGAALAFGARDPIRNALAFFSIVMDPPFRLGDRVRLDDFRGRISTVGTVISITLGSVILETDKRTRVSIANVRIDELRVENLSAADRRLLELTVPVPRELPTEALREACDRIERELRAHPRVSDDREATVWITGSGEGMTLRAAVWLRKASSRRSVQSELFLRIREQLESRLPSADARPRQRPERGARRPAPA